MATAHGDTFTARDGATYLVGDDRYIASDNGADDDGNPWWTLEPKDHAGQQHIAYIMDPYSLELWTPEGLATHLRATEA